MAAASNFSVAVADSVVSDGADRGEPAEHGVRLEAAGDGDVRAQQIADGVGVLGPGQAPQASPAPA